MENDQRMFSHEMMRTNKKFMLIPALPVIIPVILCGSVILTVWNLFGSLRSAKQLGRNVGYITLGVLTIPLFPVVLVIWFTTLWIEWAFKNTYRINFFLPPVAQFNRVVKGRGPLLFDVVREWHKYA